MPQKVRECSLLNTEINLKLSHFCRPVPGSRVSEAEEDEDGKLFHGRTSFRLNISGCG